MTFGRTPPPSVEGDNEDYTISHSQEYADLTGNQSGEHRTGNHDDDDPSNRGNVQPPTQIESSEDVVNQASPSDRGSFPSDGEAFPSDQRDLLNSDHDDVQVHVHVHVRADVDAT